MSFQKVTEDVTCYKPKMKASKTIEELPAGIEGYRNATVQVKADGEFNYLKYSREGESFLLNRFGRKTTGLPCLEEFKQLMSRSNVVEAEILGELYGYENGKMLSLPNFIHYLKGGDKKLHKSIKIGLFDIISINGVKCNLIAPRKFETMEMWTDGGQSVEVLEWHEASSLIQLQSLFREKVIDGGWEGLVVRFNGEVWKVKPNNGVDVAIGGVNKDNKGFELGMAKSLKMFLMNEDGSFVEIGDCSGVGEDEAKELFKLTQLKIGEDNKTVFVKPVVIATVEYIETYPDTVNRRFIIEGDKIKEIGVQTLVKLKSPHILKWRSDKSANIHDIGLNQINEC
jgi:hypothetical protein